MMTYVQMRFDAHGDWRTAEKMPVTPLLTVNSCYIYSQFSIQVLFVDSLHTYLYPSKVPPCYVRLGSVEIINNNKSRDRERQSPCEDEFSIE